MKDKDLAKNKFYWLYLFGFFLILALPLLNLPPWFSPPNWGKTIVFRIILSILFFLFIKQVLSKKISSAYIKDKIKTILLAFWLLFALFGIYLLATIFSLDSHFSLWGNPYRSGGFVNFSFYIIFAVITFLIVHQKDWQKIWDFTIIVGILISIITIFQQFGIFSKFFIPFTSRPIGTIGNPIFLAIYLLLLIFLTLSFGIKSKNRTKKAFYFFSLLLFLSIAVILTQTRAAFAGLAIGSLWFLFAYPKKVKLFKISVGIFLILGIFGIYFLNSHFDILKNQPFIIRSAIGRMLSLTEGAKIGESRISAWKVSWKALKDRSVLGYGPENFSIGFDKYYDASLPLGVEWWDRAHNFIFDISVTAGIPALIIYLSLFGVLFLQLQKVKRKRLETAIVCHGIQATFIGYLVANFFSFDIFDTYLIFFLLIGYSLFLLSSYSEDTATNKKSEKAVFEILYKHNKIILSVLFIFLVWFIWSFNIKPLKIYTQVNIAKYLVENGKCEQAFVRMDNVLAKKSFLDNYIRLKYVDFLKYVGEEMPEKSLEFAKKGYEILKENIETQPYYTRNWILLGAFTNALIEKEKDPEVRQELIKEVNYYFERAHQLSPKRQEVLTEWIKTDILTGQYQEAKEKSEQCINLNDKLAGCWWLAGLSHAYLNDLEESDYYLEIAKKKGHPVKSKASWLELTKAYIEIKNYARLVETYSELIKLEPDNAEKAQLHAFLAVVYKELGDKGKAREVALKALELHPAAKPVVDEFLRSLEQ